MSDDHVLGCQTASEFISALYDGERVPTPYAEHVDACPDCRSRLREYSKIGAELRLLASRTPQETHLPHALRERVMIRRPWLKFARGAVLVPRYAVAMVAGLLVLSAAGIIRLNAQQSRQLWFQYAIEPKGWAGSPALRGAVKAGYDDYFGMMTAENPYLGVHFAVTKIENDNVEIRLHSRVYGHVTNSSGIHFNEDLHSLAGYSATVRIGERLEIPMEGGGILVVSGRVLDHQPRFITGDVPVEPNPDQLVLSSPVLISGDEVLHDFKGGTAVANSTDDAVIFFVPGTGLLKLALQPFPGAVQAEAAWGRLDFQLNDRKYGLLTTSQMTGGDQPHAIWIKNDPDFSAPGGSRGFIGGVPRLSAPSW